MSKEELRKAFEAGRLYWSYIQTDEPMLLTPINFEEWYASQFKQDEQSDAVEFAEWITKGYYYWVPSEQKWTATSLIDASPLKNYKAIKSRKTTQELYTLFKDEQLKKK